MTVSRVVDATGGPATGVVRWRPAALARPVLVAGAALAGVAWVGSVDPNEPGHYPTCPFLSVTGWFCPGCGSLRALHALAHGDLRTALARNPLMVLTVPMLMAWWTAWLVREVRRRPRRWAAPAWTIWGLLVLVLAFSVARNLPGAAFLAP
jgi:hypothetical protein